MDEWASDLSEAFEEVRLSIQEKKRLADLVVELADSYNSIDEHITRKEVADKLRELADEYDPQPIAMNQLRAFSQTLELAWQRGMHFLQNAENQNESMTYRHLVQMHDQASTSLPGFSPSKLGRWLGWAQAAVVASGVADLEDMKQINKENS